MLSKKSKSKKLCSDVWYLKLHLYFTRPIHNYVMSTITFWTHHALFTRCYLMRSTLINLTLFLCLLAISHHRPKVGLLSSNSLTISRTLPLSLFSSSPIIIHSNSYFLSSAGFSSHQSIRLQLALHPLQLFLHLATCRAFLDCKLYHTYHSFQLHMMHQLNMLFLGHLL